MRGKVIKMRYGIICSQKGSRKAHIGMIYSYHGGDIKLDLRNKRNSLILRGRNKKLFRELLKTINKFYTLEDLNKKNKSGLACRNKNIKIRKGTL